MPTVSGTDANWTLRASRRAPTFPHDRARHHRCTAYARNTSASELNERFADVAAAERANYQIYLSELCDAIGVERPRPAAVGGRIADHTAYQFEFPVQTTARDGAVSTNFIDLFKAGHFALEAKHFADGAGTTTALTKAFGQVLNYARDLTRSSANCAR